MGIQVNQAILADDLTDDGTPGFPDGVYSVSEWDEMKASKTLPVDRVELFRVNEKVYTAPKRVSGQVIFRFMRSTRKANEEDARPVADLMYAVLGEAVVNALADEELSDDEFDTVMKVVQKHVAGATKRTVGKS